ncbi:unnamed protein product [Rotaria magnacalcarata]|uniref:ABC transmembrane type-1 domain-containing protein n=1 Tax=Rotaria magnacalcarata TaxID=392030 RepID=A0A816YUY9_9BILA|nr:unnamed protein product [Rotaria magnacalcarata]
MGKGSKDGLTDKNNIGGLYMDKINNFSHMKTYLYALRYLWPPNKPRLWFEFLLSLVFMIAASASDLYGPIPMQRIITVMSGTTPNSSEKESISFPTMDFIAFGLVTFSSGLFPNLRDLLFAAVSVETECSVCTETFHHLQQLSLSFHLRRETGGLLRAVSHALLNYETVRYFNAEKHEEDRYNMSTREYSEAELKALYVYGLTSVVQSCILSFSTFLIILLAGYEVYFGVLTVADLVMMYQYIQSLYQPLDQLGKLYRDLRQQILDAEAMLCLLKEPIEVDDKENAPPFNLNPAEKTEIEFRNVLFDFHTKENKPKVPLIKNLSFKIKSGDRLAIVGPSGKSTFILSVFKKSVKEKNTSLETYQNIISNRIKVVYGEFVTRMLELSVTTKKYFIYNAIKYYI